MLFQIAILIFPVFLIIVFGFLCRTLEILIDEDIDTLVRFCQNIGIPILLFYNILNLNLNIIFEIGMWFSYYSSLFACFFIGFLGTKYFFFQKTCFSPLFIRNSFWFLRYVFKRSFTGSSYLCISIWR